MRRKIVAGNWKMNKSKKEAEELLKAIIGFENEFEKDVILFPPFPYLDFMSRSASSKVKIGAQNVASQESGAFTGEVAAGMIASVGCGYVLVGHSERRQYFNESNEDLLAKTKLSLKHELQVVYCCGESLEERESGNHFKVVEEQIASVIFKLNTDQLKHIVIAYEPVWAIGTGKTASTEQAQEMHAFIRNLIADHAGEVASNNISILYGGSCKPENAAELFRAKDIDGGLIGGASLVAEDFRQIILA